MIDIEFVFNEIADLDCTAVRAAIEHRLSATRYGDWPQWHAAYEALPEATPSQYELLSGVVIGCRNDLSPSSYETLEKSFKQLIPWRKGPFSIFGLNIDTEWRSDLKWARVAAATSPMAGRRILDVGAGNGYYLWRMRGAGARFCLGVDPSPRFLAQFAMVKRYLPHQPVHLLPLAGEELPEKLAAFDTTFSMGVLYHRRSPFDHLRELLATLRPGGELVLETLVVEGDANTVLVPEDRYAMMNNVWCIPSVAALELWLRKTGFAAIRCHDVSVTTTAEQRRTEWMRFHSLAEFLDPTDSSRTVEGYPAPRRALLTALRP